MSEHKISLIWKRESADFRYDSYNREHDITFEGGVRLRASAAPAYRGQAAYPNPEEALVFALSSCHMLTFLAIAAKRGLLVDAYEDHAVGVLSKNAAGKLAITHVTLRPKIAWGSEPPAPETLQRMHEASHRECFIANSVHTEITVESV
jgi:organic hydroperoxide reductase OsmC/OhrA